MTVLNIKNSYRCYSSQRYRSCFVIGGIRSGIQWRDR